VFYDRLQEVLIAGGFDLFVETACQPLLRAEDGRAVVAPGRYFRMHMVGYFGGDRQRAEALPGGVRFDAHCAIFLRLENREEVPDRSWLSKTPRAASP